MNRITRILNFYNWPVWLILGVGLLVVMLVPYVLASVLSAQVSQDVSRNAARGYLADIASVQSQQIERNLTQAAAALESIAENRLYLTQIQSLLGGENANLLRPAVVNMLENRLVGSGQFNWASLLTATGRVTADTRAARTNEDDSGSQAYQAAVNARLLGDDARTIVYNTPAGIRIEMVQLVRRVDGILVGYLVASVNIPATILTPLASQTGFLSTVSYLATRDGLVLTPATTRDRALESAVVAPVRDATAGQTGAARYTVGGATVEGVYMPVQGGRFALITETRATPDLVPSLFGVLNANAGLVFGLLLLVGFATVGLTALIQIPLRRVRVAMQALNENDYSVDVPLTGRLDEIGGLSRDFVMLRDRLAQHLDDQNRRTGALVRDIRATQEVARFAAGQHSIQELMDSVVNLILEQFANIYHAQIFLIDREGRYAVLQASTGKAGRQLLARGHRLGVGSTSVIGQVTRTGRTVVARDTSTSDVHRRNEFLPDTRAELAIPLRVGTRIIGVLDVQSRQRDAFDDDQINLLATMADQIAISIDNARLYQESLQRLHDINVANREQAAFDWDDYLREQRADAVLQRSGRTDTDLGAIRAQAAQSGQTVVGELTERSTVPFAVPITLRGYTLGAVAWELPAGEFNSDRVALAEELVNRLAVTLDNARLFENSQRAAERERVVNEIAAKITGKTDINEILQTAVREVGQALRAPEVAIALRVDQQPQPDQEPSGQRG
jgi:GAF domain-containing protein/HAMP domain-containing protein